MKRDGGTEPDGARADCCVNPFKFKSQDPDNRARWSLPTTKYQLEKPQQETFKPFQLRFVANESNYFSVSVDVAAWLLVISSSPPPKEAWLLVFYTKHSPKQGEAPCGPATAASAAADQQTWFPQSPSTTERWCQPWDWEPGRSDSTFHSLIDGQMWYMLKWSSRLAPATIFSCSVFRHGCHGYHCPQ